MTTDSYNKYQTREVTIQLPGMVSFINTRSVWFNRRAMAPNLHSKTVTRVRGNLSKETTLQVTFGSLTIGGLNKSSGEDAVLSFARDIAANATAHTLTEIACILSRSSLSEENKKAVLALISLSYLFAGTEKASQLLVRTPEDFIKVATSPISDTFDSKRDSENQTEGEP
jgi:hypothetical protein